MGLTKYKYKNLSKRENWKIMKYSNGNDDVHYTCKYKAYWFWKTYKEYECYEWGGDGYYVRTFTTLEGVEDFIKKKNDSYNIYSKKLDVKVEEVKSLNEKREDNIDSVLKD